jgi:hypothetical protein
MQRTTLEEKLERPLDDSTLARGSGTLAHLVPTQSRGPRRSSGIVKSQRRRFAVAERTLLGVAAFCRKGTAETQYKVCGVVGKGELIADVGLGPLD